MNNIDIIDRYFPNLTGHQRAQFEALGGLYEDWNNKINVISRKDITNLYTNHILHSLAIAKFLQPTDNTAILDLGTGGGFPGIPLAILWPQCRLHLIDRIGKKIRVASAIASEIELANVSFQHGDIGECHEQFDFVVSRAVMTLDKLIPLIRKNISPMQHNSIPNGLICLKGGDIASEINQSGVNPIVETINSYFNETFFQTKLLVYVPLTNKL